MGLFELFRKKDRVEAPPAEEEGPEIEIYSGMRVEVTTFDGRLLFVAKLMSPRGDRAELRQYSEAPEERKEDQEPIRVRIRGYNDRERKAVYMEGTITPEPRHTWKVEELVVARVGNDRSFFRLDTNLDATAASLGVGAGERPCKLLNISVGGACIRSEYPYREGDKFLLKVRLLEDRDTSLMYCQVLRVIRKEGPKAEYGCRFLELNEADEAKITQNIFAVQRRQRAKY